MNETPSRPILYTKQDCPWSAEVRAVLDEHHIDYEEQVVSQNPESCLQMMRVSGQTKAPVLEWAGEVLADLGADELRRFLAAGMPAGVLR